MYPVQPEYVSNAVEKTMISDTSATRREMQVTADDHNEKDATETEDRDRSTELWIQ